MEASRQSRARQAAPLGIQLSGPLRRTGTPRPGLGEPQWSQAALSLGVPFGSPSAPDRVVHVCDTSPAIGSHDCQPSVNTSCPSGHNSEEAVRIPLVSVPARASQHSGTKAPATPGESIRFCNPQRSDAPVLRTGRQIAPKLQRPSDRVTQLDEALVHYQRDKFASSTLATRSSLERTWLEYHGKVCLAQRVEHRRKAFPLTTCGLAAIAALMKLDDFRGFSSYLSWAKGEHIRLGFHWSQQLDQEAREAGRSVNRGLGPARQSAAFTLELVAQGSHPRLQPVPRLPAYPYHMVLLSSLWVLREIEAAWACAGDITIDHARKTVAWFLPVSKTDPRALAVTRSWGCLCTSLQLGLCPYHLFVDYLQLLRANFGDGADLPRDFPLFPDNEGRVVTKRAAVRGLEQVLTEVGCSTVDPAGRKSYGGHSFRVSGSRFWTLHGLELFKLQIFARWGSNAILRYVTDIPLVTITGDVSGSSSSASHSARSLAPLLESHVRDAQAQLDALRQEMSNLRGQLQPSYVRNNQTKIWHHVLIAGIGSSPHHWKALCGWRFGLVSHRLTADAPDPSRQRCAKCSRRALSSAEGSESEASDGTYVSIDSAMLG